jgi:hypothetical protein
MINRVADNAEINTLSITEGVGIYNITKRNKILNKMDIELKKMTQEVEQIVGKTNLNDNTSGKKINFAFFKNVDPKLIYPCIFMVVFVFLVILRPEFLYETDTDNKKTFSISKLLVYSVIFFSLISIAYFALANSKFLNK